MFESNIQNREMKTESSVAIVMVKKCSFFFLLCQTWYLHTDDNVWFFNVTKCSQASIYGYTNYMIRLSEHYLSAFLRESLKQVVPVSYCVRILCHLSISLSTYPTHTCDIQQKAVYRSGSVQTQRDKQPQSFTFTPKANLASPVKLTSIALWEYLAGKGRSWKLHTEKAWPRNLLTNLLTRSLLCWVKCFSTFTKSVLSGEDAVRLPMTEITILYVCGEDNYILSSSVAARSYNYIPIFKIKIKTIR